MRDTNSEKKKCICFFNTAKVWGGGEKWHFEHALALQKQGIEVIAVSAPDSDLYHRLTENSITVYTERIRTSSFLNPLKKRRIYKILKKHQVSTLIINLSTDLKIAAPVAKAAGVEQVIYRRGSAIPVKPNPLNKFLLLKKIDTIIANSIATKSTLQQHIAIPDTKIRVIYNGIHTEKYRPQIKSESPVVIGGLGRLNKQKGFHLFIDTLAELHQRGFKYHAEIGGKGELESELKQYATEKGLDNYIVFSGFQEDINQFMSRIDLFFLSSKWEGFGYVIAEAALCGKACVGFDISSNPELILHGKTGFLTPAFDTATAAEYIRELAEKKTLRDEMGTKARTYVSEHFSFVRSVEEIKKMAQL